MLRFRQQLLAAPPPPPPAAAAPVINLDTATGHMTDMTADAITENLRAWYEMFAENNAEATASSLAGLNAELRDSGNPHGEGPPMLLVNTGGANVEILTCLTEVPQGTLTLPAASVFTQNKYVAVLGSRHSAIDTWQIVPVSADQLFRSQQRQLCEWKRIPDQGAPANGITIPTKRGNKPEFFSVFPLCGKAICDAMLEGLAPLDPANKWSLPRLGQELKPYVDAITDDAVKTPARQALSALISNRSNLLQAGSIKFDDLAYQEPANKAALDP